MATTEAFTVRTEPDIIHQLDQLAESLDRSRNYIVNQALREYLRRHADKIEKTDQNRSLDRLLQLSDEEIIRKIEDVIERKKREQA
ncbi:ribbon-helix-helix domain-containing protein [Methylotuvimicrobium sp. KM2]|uniref:CopG family ribbon-helix-helix protein n=1 Tax=Methylotuvimicrobium sp. KM2 TaxID=3133976 RepID=UPI0031011CA8